MWKCTSLVDVAVYSFTGMDTRPNAIVPDAMARAGNSFSLRSAARAGRFVPCCDLPPRCVAALLRVAVSVSALGLWILHHHHRGALTGKGRGCRQAGGPGADDYDIPLTFSLNFRCRCSHVPRMLIQNDSNMSRMSSQKDRRLT